MVRSDKKTPRGRETPAGIRGVRRSPARDGGGAGAARGGEPSSYEGIQAHVRAMDMPGIDTWVFQYPKSDTEIAISIPEFTCICPKTGQPDFAVLEIRYRPDSLCLELKSLKEYIQSYREVGIFHEHAVNRVLVDCVQSCRPMRMEVRGVFNARGGIQTIATARYPRSGEGLREPLGQGASPVGGRTRRLPNRRSKNHSTEEK